MLKLNRILALVTVAVVAGPALGQGANDPAACKTIRMSDPGWTDINSTNGIAKTVLDALGYDAQVTTLSVPIGFEALKSGQSDVFLGNWMPAQASFRADLDKAGAVEVLNRNLEGAKFTLAVTGPGAKLGVKDFDDLDAHRDAFEGKIYGIEPGAPANQSIGKMIEADAHGLGDWELVETGEQAMLAQVARNDAAGKPSVFLAWAPHPMNETLQITYLTGGDKEFGPNYGGAEVFTLARKGWAAECPNAAKLLKQMTFTVPMENQIMDGILNNGEAPADSARAWLKANPDVLGPWLDGVTTLDGQPGLPAVEAALK
ncbi:choline ABC transporter substrate-binding protein [Paracoccus suum]|uniref:Choline ABC transporter substrate-binding protein n=1 Tax=Paracoccus suum TaxID=2259340 RepID=A0A344PHL1_9RHOB|nr:choline ABC transporter substrate-binding protein [Paracoccus suum]AXC48866.1 choline ABC transporter substrate-binding protein [Paracoccus suum]